MTDKKECAQLLDLLARWQAFSELQQRAFAFLASEAVATGQEFENSTEGATSILTRIGESVDTDLKAETWAVVHKLQAADRSRQGLEQVASVLTTLKAQHAELAEMTRATGSEADLDATLGHWIEPLSATVNLADWRRRLEDALHGREPSAPADIGGDDELF